MAVGWGSVSVSTALTLTGSYATIQQSAADMVVQLAANEQAMVTFDFDPQGSPTEFCRAVVLASPDDGTHYDTPESPYAALALTHTDDPSIGTVVVAGVEQFKMQGTLFDTDGTAGGTDTTSTLTAHVRIATLS